MKIRYREYTIDATKHGADIFKNNVYITTVADETTVGVANWIHKAKKYIKEKLLG